MRLLRYIHEQISNPLAGLEVDSEQTSPETTGEHELKEEVDLNSHVAGLGV
jgi:hypothetical protein